MKGDSEDVTLGTIISYRHERARENTNDHRVECVMTQLKARVCCPDHGTGFMFCNTAIQGCLVMSRRRGSLPLQQTRGYEAIEVPLKSTSDLERCTGVT
jgi:hypothetical protein